MHLDTLPGFFGKLPGEGDFVSRQLPPSFTQAWDGWLQAGLAAARRQFGARWAGLWLTAPVWRFRLHAGVAGPQAWLGLWFPSVDRVGRCFPLTVAVALPAVQADAHPLESAGTLLDALEDAALQALDPCENAATLAQRLQAVVHRQGPWPVQRPCVVPARGGDAAHFATAGGEGFGAMQRGFDALPPAAAFAGFLLPEAA